MTRRGVGRGLRVGALTTSALLAGCVVGPDYHRPALSASAGYGAAATSGGPASPRLASGSDIPAQWWEIFHSSELDDLVALALKNSPTVEAAKASLHAAREQRIAQQGAYYPTISAGLQPSHQDFARTLSSPLESNAEVFDLTTAQVTVAYTPDLFGANKRAVESLAAQEDQQRYQLEAARLTLASNVVVAAIQDALLRAQIAEAKSVVAEQQSAVGSFERQLAHGQASSADLAAQRTLLVQAQTALPPLEKQFHINRDLLAALVGRTPGEPLEIRFDLQSLSLPDEVPLSLPAQLVKHRPDVRVAEAQLHAASAQVGVAEAARWPSLTISGAAGSAAISLLPTFGPEVNFWNVAATLTQPIFEGGTLKHRQRAAEAAYDQAAAQYQATVVGAFQNTADVLHALNADAAGLTVAESAAAVSHKSLDIAQRQFAMGETSALSVLSAEQADHQARSAMLQARANRYADVAALFQALGGGWWNQRSA